MGDRSEKHGAGASGRPLRPTVFSRRIPGSKDTLPVPGKGSPFKKRCFVCTMRSVSDGPDAGPFLNEMLQIMKP